MMQANYYAAAFLLLTITAALFSGGERECALEIHVPGAASDLKYNVYTTVYFLPFSSREATSFFVFEKENYRFFDTQKKIRS